VSDIHELITKKLQAFPPDVERLAIEALKLSEAGLPETSIAEGLANVVRQIAKGKGDKN